MKICLIGNSHIACVKKAWDSLSSNYHSDSITFFGSHADTLLNTKGKNNKLIPTNEQVQNSFKITSNGHTEIDFTLFDICLIHGILPPLRGWYNLSEDFKKNITYSQDFINLCIKNYNPIIKHLINEITSCTTIPTLFTPKPNPAIPKSTKLISNEDFMYTCQFMTSGFNNLGLHYLPQPEETLLNFSSTKNEYNKNGLGLGRVPTKEAKLAPPENNRHMNQLYGEVYLKNIFLYLNKLNEKTSRKHHYISDTNTNSLEYMTN